MTTLAISRRFAPVTMGLARSASSDEALHLWRILAGTLSELKRARSDRQLAFSELSAMDYDGSDSDAVAVEVATLILAERFLTVLPLDIPSPEVGVDPDGEISFDWFGPEGQNFSVSLRKDGRLAYAGAFAGEKTKYGTDRLDDEIPREIVEAVRELQWPNAAAA
jgi:hypothetical protein